MAQLTFLGVFTIQMYILYIDSLGFHNLIERFSRPAMPMGKRTCTCRLQFRITRTQYFSCLAVIMCTCT